MSNELLLPFLKFLNIKFHFYYHFLKVLYLSPAFQLLPMIIN